MSVTLGWKVVGNVECAKIMTWKMEYIYELQIPSNTLTTGPASVCLPQPRN